MELYVYIFGGTVTFDELRIEARCTLYIYSTLGATGKEKRPSDHPLLK